MGKANIKTINERNESLEKWVEALTNENTRNYIEIRVIPQMGYYSKASRKYKKKYFRIKILIIVLGAMIPIATLFCDYSIFIKAFIALLGASVSALTTYLELENSQALWQSYRVKREQILSLLMWYFTDTGIFADISDQKIKDRMMIETCEQYLSEEHQYWKEISGKANGQEKKEEKQ